MLTRLVCPQIGKLHIVSKGYKFNAWKIPQVSSGTDRVCFGSHLLANEQASVQEIFYHGDKGSGQQLFISHAAPLPI